MELSDRSREAISREFSYIAKMIKEEQDILRKAYFFSGSYGIIHRILNLEFDDSLILIHNVLQSAYMSVNSTSERIIGGQEKVIEIPEGVFNKLAGYVEDLGKRIANNGDIWQPLEKIVTIGYLFTGNGYYLYRKGNIRL